MNETALPQEPQTPEPETLPASETLPAPKKRWAAVGCRLICLTAYILGGGILGTQYGTWCACTYFDAFFQQPEDSMQGLDALLEGTFFGVLLIGTLGMVTGLLMGRYMANIRGALRRWLAYAAAGLAVGTVIGCGIVFCMVFGMVIPRGMVIPCGILFATLGSLLFCAEKIGMTRKAIIRRTVIVTAIGILGTIGMGMMMLPQLFEDHPKCFAPIVDIVGIGMMASVLFHGKATWIGAGIGTILGAILGLTWGFLFNIETPLARAVSSVLGAMIGTLIGTAIGAVINGVIDGEVILTTGSTWVGLWIAVWIATRVGLQDTGCFLWDFGFLPIFAVFLGVFGKWLSTHLSWGTGGKTGTLLGAALGTILGSTLGSSYEHVLFGIQGLTAGLTLGAIIGAVMDTRRQRSNVSELPTDSTL